VVAAINQLSVEGYLASRVGSGTYVNDNVPRAVPSRGARSGGQPATLQAGRLSTRGIALSSTFCATELEVQPFTPGMVDFSAFPVALWQRLQNKHWRMTYPDMLDYNTSGGYAPLRRAVADYLRVFRSVHLEADQVVITSGTQQSLELCARLLADHGDTVWVEDPAYWGAVKAFMATGLAIHPVPVDEEGISPSAADSAQPPRLIYVTPSHQYPTGAVMTLPRRHQLLATARAHDAWVLEDDYDSEYRFSGPPISSLEGLDTDGRVLYMGTFSKVLYLWWPPSSRRITTSTARARCRCRPRSPSSSKWATSPAPCAAPGKATPSAASACSKPSNPCSPPAAPSSAAPNKACTCACACPATSTTRPWPSESHSKG